MTAVLALSHVLASVFAQDGFVAYGNSNQWAFVAAGWAAVVVGFTVYAVLLMRKGRQLSKQVPPKDRRWMS